MPNTSKSAARHSIHLEVKDFCRLLTVVYLRCAFRLDSQQISVPKSGGSFQLEFGGLLTVQADTFNKRTTLTCAGVPPDQRYRFEPTLRCAQLLSYTKPLLMMMMMYE